MAEYVCSSDSRLLGFGTDGVVRVGIHKLTGEKVAIKSMYPYKHLLENIIEEADILDELMDHPNILKLLGLTTNNIGTFMVFELMDTDLYELGVKRRLCPQDIKLVMRQLLEALAWMHKKRVVHQDVKSANIMVKTNSEQKLVVKLGDFSSARRLWTPPWSQKVGTLSYNAPEVLKGDMHLFGTPMDIWSTGCVFAELLLGVNPMKLPDGNSLEPDIVDKLAGLDIGSGVGNKFGGEKRVLEKIRQWNVEEHRNEINDPNAVELLQQLLTLNPLERITAQEALELAYFKTNDGELNLGPTRKVNVQTVPV